MLVYVCALFSSSFIYSLILSFTPEAERSSSLMHISFFFSICEFLYGCNDLTTNNLYILPFFSSFCTSFVIAATASCWVVGCAALFLSRKQANGEHFFCMLNGTSFPIFVVINNIQKIGSCDMDIPGNRNREGAR